ncbi:cell division transport system permease protein [Maridesulfovibrio ferrireducens]|uniref:Cell division protein FtsX n=1 Tax=Maridesulfovibrio ferrireducens TaxID=246191 RepID=A0A1G9C6R2_9BACT|nr:permease-like cell division protein FtsX [Maridesulfovibrio ferrireducens]SDK47357.1 cell division transport system permease protein [Maridesulfovibrio ferrireducens]
MIFLLFRLIGRGIRDLGLHPWANLFTLIAVTMVSLLAGLFMVTLHNVNQELLKSRGQVQIQLFWQAETSSDEYSKQWENLSKLEGLKEIRTFTPDEALKQLSEALSGTDDFSWMKEGNNPLQPTALLAFSVEPGVENEMWATDLLNQLKALPFVDKVHYNPLQIDLARGWINLTQSVIWPIIGFLGLVVALVVGNTIRLSLMTRKDEIEILSLVGAKQWFIRLPLLTGGALLGLLGSSIALGTLYGAQRFFEDALNFPPLFMKLTFLPPEQCGALIGAVTLIGMLSSFVAVRG